MKIHKELVSQFVIPFLVLASIGAYLLANLVLHQQLIGLFILFAGIIIGSFDLVEDTAKSIMEGDFALDYIAILAIAVSILTGEYLVAAILVLMLSGGNTLEKYATRQAKASLTALKDRIPNQVVLWKDGHAGNKVSIESVNVGSLIFVRKGEVIPLDGVLQSENAQTDESSLTGEPYMMEKEKGDHVRSGTINVSDPIVIRVTKADADSTYRKIIEMVKQAQEEKPRIVRLAKKYSTVFTIITLVIAGSAFIIWRDFTRVLAILVIATPCPLILATPIALIGGMNSAAKKRIIVKKLSSMETLSRVNTLIFDKTGTITIGKPVVRQVKIVDRKYTLKDVYSISEAIERNSLHPLAKAVVSAAREFNAPVMHAAGIEEKIGLGISGTVNRKRFTLSKPPKQEKTAIMLMEGGSLVAELYFEDSIKSDSVIIVDKLRRAGLELHIFTGDKREAADSIVKHIREPVSVRAECSPEDKKNGVKELKSLGRITAMVGDGINDAPALAIADVGMVFSHEEHTAASEAADMVFLGGDLKAVHDAIQISKNTIGIAMQSIIVGIGLSIIGMLLAAFGFIPPIIGAFLQEVIDVSVIINALRASR
ncbi:cadmium-translocating P-type ATPase [Candidatus Woesearchaeota archaeon]|nr:cadmium-translocating P-type ATPase [Candidatus Woesearchaeota archaeon]